MLKLFKLLFSKYKKIFLSKSQKDELILRYKFEKNMHKLFITIPKSIRNIKNI
jgi:hypothetical protein